MIGRHAVTRVALVDVQMIVVVVVRISCRIGRGIRPEMRKGLKDRIGEIEVIVQRGEAMRVHIHFDLYVVIVIVSAFFTELLILINLENRERERESKASNLNDSFTYKTWGSSPREFGDLSDIKL